MKRDFYRSLSIGVVLFFFFLLDTIPIIEASEITPLSSNSNHKNNSDHTNNSDNSNTHNSNSNTNNDNDDDDGGGGDDNHNDDNDDENGDNYDELLHLNYLWNELNEKRATIIAEATTNDSNDDNTAKSRSTTKSYSTNKRRQRNRRRKLQFSEDVITAFKLKYNIRQDARLQMQYVDPASNTIVMNENCGSNNNGGWCGGGLKKSVSLDNATPINVFSSKMGRTSYVINEGTKIIDLGKLSKSIVSASTNNENGDSIVIIKDYVTGNVNSIRVIETNGARSYFVNIVGDIMVSMTPDIKDDYNADTSIAFDTGSSIYHSSTHNFAGIGIDNDAEDHIRNRESSGSSIIGKGNNSKNRYSSFLNDAHKNSVYPGSSSSSSNTKDNDSVDIYNRNRNLNNNDGGDTASVIANNKNESPSTGSDIRSLRATQAAAATTTKFAAATANDCEQIKFMEIDMYYDSTFCEYSDGEQNAITQVIEIFALASQIYLAQGICVRLEIGSLDGYCNPDTDEFAPGIALGNIGCGGDEGVVNFFLAWMLANKNEWQDTVASAHMFFAQDMNEGTYGCANTGALCTLGVGVNNQSFTYDNDRRSALFAHELGHNVGLNHVVSPEGVSYVMDGIGGGVHIWSPFSLTELASLFPTRECVRLDIATITPTAPIEEGTIPPVPVPPVPVPPAPSPTRAPAPSPTRAPVPKSTPNPTKSPTRRKNKSTPAPTRRKPANNNKITRRPTKKAFLFAEAEKKGLLNIVQPIIADGDMYVVRASSSTDGNALCLNVPKGDTSKDTVVRLWNCNGKANQLWTVDIIGRMHSAIKYNKCLGANTNGTGGNNMLRLYNCRDDLFIVSQRWSYNGNASNNNPIPVAPNSQVVISSQWKMNMCMRANKRGNPIRLVECQNNNKNQKFEFSRSDMKY